MKNNPNSIYSVIKYIKNKLIELYPEQEIQSITNIILEEVLQLDRIKIRTQEERVLANDQIKTIEDILQRLMNYEPIQYIIGKSHFYNIHLKVAPEVLIPRPETEELVDWVLHENKHFNGSILDIGTGSGCIIISLARNFEKGSFYALDKYPEALVVASSNAHENITQIEFMQMDILEFEKHDNIPFFDIIVSNPPYIPEKEKLLMQRNVLEYEPISALFVENSQPLIYYEKITAFALEFLNNGGKVYFEINENYGKEVVDLLEKNNFSEIILKKDINGKNRMVRAIKNFQ